MPDSLTLRSVSRSQSNRWLGYNMALHSKPSTQPMIVEARAHPNIALIKYWGKKDTERNIPAVSSVSITLDSLEVVSRVQAADSDSLTINGVNDPQATERASRCLDAMRTLAGIHDRPLRIESTANFPVAAGLASSAAGFAALVSAANRYFELELDALTLARLAGAGSGSAARSMYGGFVQLTTPRAPADDIHVQVVSSAADWPLSVVIAVTETGHKHLSSGRAMQHSAQTSDFYAAWVNTQDPDIAVAVAAIKSRDFAALAAVSEASCLKMHSVMLASRPSTMYWNATTVSLMQRVRELRTAGLDVFFTIDAGPQLKAVCLPESATAVADALRDVEGVKAILLSGLGPGARADLC